MICYIQLGGVKLSQIQHCEAGSVDTLLFVTRNEQTRDVAHQLKGLSVPAYYDPHYLCSELSSVPNL